MTATTVIFNLVIPITVTYINVSVCWLVLSLIFTTKSQVSSYSEQDAFSKTWYYFFLQSISRSTCWHTGYRVQSDIYLAIVIEIISTTWSTIQVVDILLIYFWKYNRHIVTILIRFALFCNLQMLTKKAK